jgi:hypothetical protein
MHRSRLSALAIFAGAAACSTRGDPGATRILSQDPTLVATLEVRQRTQQPPLPDACGAIAVAAQPAVADKPQAEKLARQAYDAELLGKPQEARTLLRRASELDGTDRSAAYHLGRTSEALGDRTGAMTAYCRFLALTPTTAESVEARQRVAKLSQSEPRKAAGNASNSAPTGRRVAATTARRVTRGQSTAERRVATRARVEQSVPGTSHARGAHRSSAVTGAADDLPAPSDGVTTSTEVDGRSDRAGPVGDVIAAPRRVPAVDQPSTASRTESRSPSRVQAAGIGAIAGAIIGAAAGRSVKSAVIGAAAGGVLGTVVGGGIRPAGRGIRPWATGAQQPAGARPARLPMGYAAR